MENGSNSFSTNDKFPEPSRSRKALGASPSRPSVEKAARDLGLDLRTWADWEDGRTVPRGLYRNLPAPSYSSITKTVGST